MKVLWIIPGDSHNVSKMCFVKRQLKSINNSSNIECHGFYLGDLSSIKNIYQKIIDLRSYCRNNNFDILHAQYGTITCFVGLFLFHKKYIITYRGSDLNPSPGDNKVKNIVGRILSQFANIFTKKSIVVSLQLQNKLLYNSNKVVIIPSGIDTSIFFPIPKKLARTQLSLNSDCKLLLFNQGNNPEGKGAAFIRLVVEKLKRIYNDLEIQIFHGQMNQDQMNLFYNAADCLVFASEFEGSPNVIKEALACNLPIVANNVGDVKDRIGNVYGCYIVEKKVDEYVKHLNKVLENNKRVNGKLAIDNIKQEVLNSKLISVYRSIL